MDKIRVIAVDDEPLALGQLEKYISQVPFLVLNASFSSALEARKYLEDNAVDAMFIDVNMPDLSGIELVRTLKNPPLTVFTTAYSEYVVEGFRVDAVDYLLKPFTLGELLSSAEKVKARFELLAAAGKLLSSVPAGSVAAGPSPATPSPEDALGGRQGQTGFVFFKADYKIIKVEIADIVYVESMSEYLKIYLQDEPMPKVVLMSFPKLLEKLPSSLFVRIHRSYVINLAKLKEFSGGMVLMEGGKSLPVGDSYRSALLSRL